MVQLSPFEIGQRFIRFYQSCGFEVLPRGSLLDPSLPMTFVGSAGLTQIESAIEEGEDRSGERYALLQQCFRHFDLEKVGQSPVHLSLFEMAGAFAFGEEHKGDALRKIWSFLTNELGLGKNQLWVTYFAGGELGERQFGADTETFQAWNDIGLSQTQIVGVGIEVGFWKQGGGLSGKERFRKCGPTTEIFFDRGLQYRCGPTCQPGCKCGRFIEIANVLFISLQFDEATQSVRLLVTPFAETVIGVERVAMAVQKKSSVFEIENFASLLKVVKGCRESTTSCDSFNVATNERIIADHIRALLFLVTDGAPRPKKGGQSRIIRTLIRGILTHQKILGITRTEFISILVDAVLDLYQKQYPDLIKGQTRLLEYVEMEKRSFEKTLSACYQQLNKVLRLCVNNSINGRQALELVKRYGFPLPLLAMELSKLDISFNQQEYWQAYTHWRQMV